MNLPLSDSLSASATTTSYKSSTVPNKSTKYSTKYVLKVFHVKIDRLILLKALIIDFFNSN
jgi:hypothetical protein